MGAVRGIEHIGITVPCHQEAVAFFQAAFDARILFSLVTQDGPSLSAKEVGPKNGLIPGTRIVAVSMLRLGNGANLEVFQIDHPRRREPYSISDHGISHFSVCVDDVPAATARFEAAGGSLLVGPYALTGQEAGEGNVGRFGLTPWGLLIEFESFHSPIRYDAGATTTRWLPANE